METPKPFRWSFSQWETYNSCPAKWNYKSVQKLPSTPPGPAAARGLDMHDRVEKYILGEATTDEMMYGDPRQRFGTKKPAVVHIDHLGVLAKFREGAATGGAEVKFALDSDWFKVEGDAPNVACLGYLDAYIAEDDRIWIGEWKSGQPKDTHADQRSLYAIVGLLMGKPKVDVTTYYLERPGEPDVTSVTVDDWKPMTAMWDARIDTMKRDTICAPRPGFGCRFCDFSKDKGGPCIF